MKHILIVDDDPDKSRMVSAMTEEIMGSKVTVAHAFSYTQAEHLFAEQQPDLIFMDGQFPRGQGDTKTLTLGPRLTEQFRQLGYQGFIVAFSGDNQTRQEMMAAGCNIDSEPSQTKFADFTQIFERAGILGGP